MKITRNAEKKRIRKRKKKRKATKMSLGHYGNSIISACISFFTEEGSKRISLKSQ